MLTDTSPNVPVCKKIIIVASINTVSHLAIIAPSFPGTVRAGALDGGLLQLHADGSVPETSRERGLTLAERTRE